MPALCWFNEQVLQIIDKYNGSHRHFLANASGDEVIPQQEDCTFRTFHNTSFANMLSMLDDGYMRFGDHHGDGLGVYMYSENSAEWIQTNGAMIELKVIPYFSKLPKGSKGRYVMKALEQGGGSSDKGKICKGADLFAVWFCKDFCPQALQDAAVAAVDSSRGSVGQQSRQCWREFEWNQ